MAIENGSYKNEGGGWGQGERRGGTAFWKTKNKKKSCLSVKLLMGEAFLTCHLLLTFCKVAVCDNDCRQNAKMLPAKAIVHSSGLLLFYSISALISRQKWVFIKYEMRIIHLFYIYFSFLKRRRSPWISVTYNRHGHGDYDMFASVPTSEVTCHLWLYHSNSDQQLQLLTLLWIGRLRSQHSLAVLVN